MIKTHHAVTAELSTNTLNETLDILIFDGGDPENSTILEVITIRRDITPQQYCTLSREAFDKMYHNGTIRPQLLVPGWVWERDTYSIYTKKRTSIND